MIKRSGNAKALAKNIEMEVGKALYVIAEKVKEQAIKLITSGGKGGIAYKRRTVTHIASAAGEAPANDTGRLIASINTTIDVKEQTARVTAGDGNVVYATMLEFGTKNMAARPFFYPAGKMTKKFTDDRFAKALKLAADKTTQGAKR